MLTVDWFALQLSEESRPSAAGVFSLNVCRPNTEQDFGEKNTAYISWVSLYCMKKMMFLNETIEIYDEEHQKKWSKLILDISVLKKV